MASMPDSPSAWSRSGSTATKTSMWPPLWIRSAGLFGTTAAANDRAGLRRSSSAGQPRLGPSGALRGRGDRQLPRRPRPLACGRGGPGRGGQPARPAEERRRRGKSDPVDAEAAARAALAGEDVATPKAANGTVEMVRALRVARRSAGESAYPGRKPARQPGRHRTRRTPLPAPRPRTRPAGRGRRRPPPGGGLTCPGRGDQARLAGARPPPSGPWVPRSTGSTRNSPRARAQGRPGAAGASWGGAPRLPGALLIAAGDNPDRLRTEAAFAMLCGSSPLQASSGKTVRHRLNRGGDRQANNALWMIARCRMACDQRTKGYVARRTAEGKSKREIIRCLKRLSLGRSIGISAPRSAVDSHRTSRYQNFQDEAFGCR